MNRTHLEGAAEALAAQQGYAFHTGPEDGMAHTMRSYRRHGSRPSNCTPSKDAATAGRRTT